jgi:hypothetical protein
MRHAELISEAGLARLVGWTGVAHTDRLPPAAAEKRKRRRRSGSARSITQPSPEPQAGQVRVVSDDSTDPLALPGVASPLLESDVCKKYREGVDPYRLASLLNRPFREILRTLSIEFFGVDIELKASNGTSRGGRIGAGVESDRLGALVAQRCDLDQIAEDLQRSRLSVARQLLTVEEFRPAVLSRSLTKRSNFDVAEKVRIAGAPATMRD